MPKKKPVKKKASKKKPPELYYKGKRLNNSFKEAVKKVGSLKKVDISTPAKLKHFYEQNKETFSTLFEIGLETPLAGSSKVFNQFDKAEDNEHEFYKEEFGELKPISAKNAKFELAKLEQHLNVIFGSTGVEYSYKKKLDNSVIISIPDEEELEALESEPVEFINDYLSNFGIKIYTSDESKKKKFLSNEPKRKSYSERVNTRFKQYRKEYNKSKRKATKGKTKRKKR